MFFRPIESTAFCPSLLAYDWSSTCPIEPPGLHSALTFLKGGLFLSPEAITVTRQELYDRVWSTPMQTLARDFGLSDVGLAKLCRRHEIPLPGRGYWARIQYGQQPGRVSLAPLKEPGLDTIRILPSEPKSNEVPMPEEGDVYPTIEVAENRPITHRMARRIESSIARKTRDERGILATRQGRVVPLKLTAGAACSTRPLQRSTRQTHDRMAESLQHPTQNRSGRRENAARKR